MPSGLHQPHTPRPSRSSGDRNAIHEFPIDDRGWSRRSLLAGVIGTILFHLLFVFGIPPSYLDLGVRDEPPPGSELDFELVEEPVPEEKPQPRFVETNPEAPDNAPDQTDNFSARNQQAANEKPPEELSPDRTPAREGEDEVPFDKMIAGELNPPVEAAPPVPETPPEMQEQPPSQPRAQIPLPGFEADIAESEEGVGSSIAEALPDATPVPERVEGERTETDDRELPAFTSPLAAVQRQQQTPAPRPRLPRVLPGPVKRQPVGVTQTGTIGMDSKFSQFGEYEERMMEAVSQRWTALCVSRAYRESGTTVVLEFKLTREGKIHSLETVANTAEALGVLLARTALEQGQPYGVWPKDMIDTLGEEQNVILNFHYW